MAILNGWQAIADYLKVSIGTAKHYAQKQGLPIRKRGYAILATTRSVDLWIEGRWPPEDSGTEE